MTVSPAFRDDVPEMPEPPGGGGRAERAAPKPGPKRGKARP